MCESNVLSIKDHFGSLPDPRIDRQKRHELIDIVTITICAVLSGAEAWTHVEAFGKAKEEWFRTFLELPGGIPSHDTFGRFFSLLDPSLFQDAFLQWVQAVNDVFKDQVIALDDEFCKRLSYQIIIRSGLRNCINSGTSLELPPTRQGNRDFMEKQGR